MADNIELVVKIPEELYEAYKGRPPMLGDAGMDMIAQSIANGVPLPKGHGDLIDRNDVSLMTVHIIDGIFVCNASTIIAADKEKDMSEI